MYQDDYLITSHSFRERTAKQFFEDHKKSYEKRLEILPSPIWRPFEVCPSLTILIPSCKKHEESTKLLCKELGRQGLHYIVDSREDVDLGTKRQDLYRKSESVYSVQWDADDWISGDFGLKLHDVLENARVDCINFLEHVIMGDKTTLTRRSLHFPWSGCSLGGQFCFSPNTKSIIKTKLARLIDFRKDCKGEDLEFGRDIRSLLNSEINLDYIGYFYEYTSEGTATGTNEHQVRN